MSLSFKTNWPYWSAILQLGDYWKYPIVLLIVGNVVEKVSTTFVSKGLREVREAVLFDKIRDFMATYCVRLHLIIR